MKSFKDLNGRQWIVQINYSARQRVKALVNLDLFDPSVFDRLGDDPGLILEVLYAVCQEQAEKDSIRLEQFADAIAGDPLDAAQEALTEALFDFFPQRRREALRKMYAAAKQMQEKALQLIEQKIDSGELLERLQQTLTPPSGAPPASAASILDRSPSDS